MIKGLDGVLKAGLWHAQKVKEYRDAMVVQVFSEIIQQTPVTTGKLVNSWRTSVNSPVVEEAKDFTDDRSKPLAELKDVVARSNIEQDIYMANGARHAYGVEFYGWAYLQRPEGMVRKNILAYQEQIQFLTEGPK